MSKVRILLNRAAAAVTSGASTNASYTSSGTRADGPLIVRLSVGSVQTRSTAVDTSGGKPSRGPRRAGHGVREAPLGPAARHSRTRAAAIPLTFLLRNVRASDRWSIEPFFKFETE